jgi:hypothetical protein
LLLFSSDNFLSAICFGLELKESDWFGDPTVGLSFANRESVGKELDKGEGWIGEWGSKKE